jgi:hypothetical protein
VKPIRQRQALLAELEVGELEFPGQDKQTDDRFAPIDVEYMFAGQLSHGALPLGFLYLPATHSVHQVLFPVAPGLQEHAATDVLPIGELEYTAQEEHVDIELAPDTLEYVFTGQSVQLTANASANLPGAHFTQSEPTVIEPAAHPHVNVSSLKYPSFTHGAYSNLILSSGKLRL